MTRIAAYEAIVLLRHAALHMVDDVAALDVIIEAQYQCYMRPGFNLRKFHEWEHKNLIGQKTHSEFGENER